jgi:filamentous hemagglutinin
VNTDVTDRLYWSILDGIKPDTTDFDIATLGLGSLLKVGYLGGKGLTAALAEIVTKESLTHKAPEVITQEAPLALEALTEPFKFTLPSLTNVVRNDGGLGEFLTKDVLSEATGLEFKAIQNASGHGIDAVAIDVNTKTILHVEVKSSTVGSYGNPGNLAERFDTWIKSASDGAITNQKLPENSKEYAQGIQDLIDQGYSVKHYVSEVSIPKVGSAGKSNVTIKPW